MAGWTTLKNLVKEEIKQKEEEGCNVTEYIEKFQNIGEDEDKILAFYKKLNSLEISKDFGFYEPTELEDIRKNRNGGPRHLNIEVSKKSLKDKFYGAWLGRCIGCTLGKPIESPDFMHGSNGRPGYKNVELWFKGAKSWPISNYVPTYSSAKEDYGININNKSHKSLLENIKFMESDDDIRYTVIGLQLLEERGLDWDSWDLGKFWHSHLPYRQLCTAETQAYLNFATITNHYEFKPENWKSKIGWVRNYLNPYREWIGAQIRVDAYAYAAAGNPELAAELAHRDASFSHVKNGVYGAMFFSAVIAAAFALNDLEELVEIGLSEIPNSSRFYKDISKAVEIGKSAENQLDLVEKVYENFKHYDAVHTNNNAALCVASIIFAKGDFEKSLTTAVLGWDTDCNGATVGSIMGAILGAKNIPKKWSDPLNDTLYSEIPGFHPIAISECANRSYNIYMKLKS